MDPVTTIVSALAVGAAAGLQNIASTAIGDTYARLKALIRTKYADVSLNKLEETPNSKEHWNTVQDDLWKAGAGRDHDLLLLAIQLLETVKIQAPDAAAAVGIDLKDFRAASLHIDDISADGTGVRIEKADIQGDVSITGVRARGQDHPPKISGAGDNPLPALLNLDRITATNVTVQVVISEDRLKELSQDIGLTREKLDAFLKRIGKDRAANSESLDATFDSLADEYIKMKETLQRFQAAGTTLGQAHPIEILETLANKRKREPESRLILGTMFAVSYQEVARQFLDFYWKELIGQVKRMRSEVILPNRKTAEADIAGQIYQGLAIDLMDVLFATLQQTQVLQEHALQSKRDGTTEWVALADSEINSSFQYPIHITDVIEVMRQNITIDIAVFLRGAVIRIEDGRATQFQSGYCEGLCRISSGEMILFQAQMGQVELPTVVRLREGIPLA